MAHVSRLVDGGVVSASQGSSDALARSTVASLVALPLPAMNAHL